MSGYDRLLLAYAAIAAGYAVNLALSRIAERKLLGGVAYLAAALLIFFTVVKLQ